MKQKFNNVIAQSLNCSLQGRSHYFDNSLRYYPNFFNTTDASKLFSTLQECLNWQQKQITLFGKTHNVPRLQAWYGDPNAYYQYSGLSLTPLAWDPYLLLIKQHVERETQCTYNSVLANYYRNGQDSMGWHCDNEPELGNQPTIASMTLGQARNFSIKHKSNGEKLSLTLQSGSLLVMSKDFQQHYLHCLPKSVKPMLGRINLTFRTII